MPTMNPRTAIAPTTLVKRLGALDMWHIVSGGSFTQSKAEPLCGQRPIRVARSYQTKTAYNATEVTCTDCLVSAIRKGRTS